VCCGKPSEVGALCRTCAVEAAPCDGLIPEHIGSKCDPARAQAWIVDGFGGAHPVGDKATVGRDLEAGIVVLESSVSREHAAFTQSDAGWSVRDLGSRNGTFVNGERIAGEVALPSRALLRIGDVTFWFLVKVVEAPPPRPETSTGGAVRGLVRFHMVFGNTELCVVAGNDVKTGGALLWRPVGSETWNERQLARLEFQLLRALCVRAHAEAGVPSPVRGCVPTKDLLRDLPFQSKYANHENVRQVVLRLRNALTECGGKSMLAIAQGRGYYLACTVTASNER
jgi:hypothetical protein